MKIYIVLLLILIIGCTSKSTSVEVKDNADTIQVDNTQTDPKPDTVYIDTAGINPKVYSNERFRDVTVEKTGDNKFVLKGKAQIFEASFSWVIEDGHNELQKGYSMTDAGAPEWGNFNFSVTAPKQNPNSTLHIILFESSPKDGSRTYELPIPLH